MRRSGNALPLRLDVDVVEDEQATSKAIRMMAQDLAAIEAAVIRLTERVARLDSERAVRLRFERD